MEDFRRGVATIQRAEIPDKVAVYVYELNLLARLAATWNMHVEYDTVDRSEYTELMANVTHDAT